VQLSPPKPVWRRVTFERGAAPVKWPLAELGAGLPADWSGQGFLTLEFRASSAQRFGLQIHTAEGPRKVNLQPMAGAWIRASVPLRYFERPDQEGHDLAALGNKPRAGYFINLTGPYGGLQKVQSLGVSMDAPLNSPTLELRSVQLEKTPSGDGVIEPKPLVDQFGQWIDADWPGKAQSLAQLEAAWSAEVNALPEGDFGWSIYGGFTNTPLQATGFFRVEKVDDRWWFVDPQGYLFFSTGVNVISPFAGTPLTGREDLFAVMPPANQSASARRPGRGQEISFHTWNLQRRYDTAWRGVWLDSTLTRLDAWGFNTIGNWSDPRLFDLQRKPYVAMLRGWGRGGVLGMPDVFAEDFAAAVDRAAEDQCAPRQDDPWLLGYFMMNEPPWPGNELGIAAGYLAGPDTALKRELKKFLADGDTNERRREFVQGAIEKFINTVSAAMKKHDPNHLNLGLRFGTRPSEAMLRASRGFDVFSMNSYEYVANRESMEKAYRITERPILIGEFHFGVPGRGLSAGLKQTANQEERGVAYRYYVEQAAAHPAVIGTHWFQWVDEPNTGRFDGENYNIGLVDVTDRPYPELIAAAKATHRRLLGVHSGKVPPVTRKAKVE
jgi:hypothetical protein